MKKLLLLIIVLAGAAYWYQGKRLAQLNPEVIANPTYAEIHMTLDARGRTFEQVLFAETVDAADCKKYSADTLQKLAQRQAGDSAGQWVLKSSECKTELLPRHAALFENKPGFITYMRMARGDRTERETRLIYWGVSLEESNKVCNGVSQMQNGRKGAVTCIQGTQL